MRNVLKSRLPTSIFTYSSFEYINLTIHRKNSELLRLIIIYRPQLSEQRQNTNNSFIREFASLMESVIPVNHSLLISGDFNYHFQKQDNTDYALKTFKDLIKSLNLVQHVLVPTHIAGNTLDLILTREFDNLLIELITFNYLPSDHSSIVCSLNIDKPPPETIQIKFREIQNINLENFRQDIYRSNLYINPPNTLDDLVDMYNSVLTGLIDKHAPLITRNVTARPNAQWFNNELRIKKRETRRLERKWKKSKLEVDHEILKCSAKEYSKMLNLAKYDFYRQRFQSTNPQQLWRQVNKILRPRNVKILPSLNIPDNDLAEKFADFFANKILNIILSINSQQPYTCLPNPTLNSEFLMFHPISSDLVESIISSSSTATCDLDPLPTSVLKLVSNAIAPIITSIINISFTTGIFPKSLKYAIILPLLKKSTLNPDSLSNYRPVSNLPFLGKTIERAAINQLNSYLNENHLSYKFQSAFREFFSTETALLRVVNDLLSALDNKREAILVLLDFSAAFDTLNHNTLLARLESHYGIKHSALNWFNSYLRDRQYSVSINGSHSRGSISSCGVPQGSVLGPLLFILYTAPMQSVLGNLKSMSYADDNQIYIELDPESPNTSIESANQCITRIHSWCESNSLKLNEPKTVILHIEPSHRHHRNINKFTIGQKSIDYSNLARNLGVQIDNNISLKPQVNAVVKSSFYEIFKLGKIKNLVSKNALYILTHALVSTKLDYCNSLYYNLPNSLIDKLQLVQNSAARLVANKRKREHIRPTLKSLHWLPVRQRIIYKILIITFKSLKYGKPEYINELLSPSPNSRLKNLLLPHIHSSYGHRSFSFSAPLEWNKIPSDIKNAKSVNTFKSKLKTHLFSIAFNN